MPNPSSYAERIDFVVELARRLHTYGTTAQRLEGAIGLVAQRLRLQCDSWSNPTGIILSFADAEAGATHADTTQVVRLAPGDVDLHKLSATDAIAEQVLSGELGLSDGLRQLRALERPRSRRAQAMTVLAFGMSSGGVAGLLRAGWADIAAAAFIGAVIGGLHVLGKHRPRVSEAFEALSALLATVLATVIALWIAPLALKSVILASLIVLLPGLMLTNAVAELSSQHLVSGTARFAGAVAVLLKLTFGTVAATQLLKLIGWVPVEPLPAPMPLWVEGVALLAVSYAFAVLFKAARRDTLLVMGAAWLGYLSTRGFSVLLGHEAGVFFAGFIVSAVANAYAQLANRPGALIRVPGIILLVPGSVGFRSLSFVLERDVFLGLDAGFALITALISLVAGLLFGNLLIPPRRNL